MRKKTLMLFALILLACACVCGISVAENAALNNDAAMYRFPYFNAVKHKTFKKSTSIDVLDEREDWYLIAANGYTGYVKKELVDMKGKPSGSLTENAEAPEFTITGFDIPAHFPLYRTVSLKGTIESTLPMTRIRVYYYYDRWMYEEVGVYQDFELSDNVLSFNADKLLRNMPTIDKLMAGEMRLCIDVSGEFGTVRAADIEFYITGKCKDPLSMTKYCAVTDASGAEVESVLNDNLDDGWSMAGEADFIDIAIPDDRKPEGLMLKWLKPPKDFAVTQYGANGEVLEALESSNENALWNTYIELDASSRRITVSTSEAEAVICELRVYQQGFVPTVVQKWQPLPDDMELFIVTAHKNDETLYFSGTLPLCFSKGQNAGVIVLTECGTRHGQEELFECMWLLGSKWQPIVLRRFDKRTTLDKEEPLLELWGGYESVCSELTALVRKYKPEVLLTHDIDGEYGHAAHKLAFKLTYDAVINAANADMYADSYEEYGAWSVSKMYAHLYDKQNRLYLPFDEALDCYGGRSPMDMAYGAFNKYQSELGNKYYSLDMDGKTYDKTCYGLYFTRVGEDVLKNDFFENVK